MPFVSTEIPALCIADIACVFALPLYFVWMLGILKRV